MTPGGFHFFQWIGQRFLHTLWGRDVYEPIQNQNLFIVDSAGRGGGRPGRVADPGGCEDLHRQHRPKIYTDSIAQPPLSPPALVFPVAWTILYALMGIGAARVALAPDSPERSRGLQIFGLQLGINFLWSILFFKFQLFGFSLLWLIALWGAILWMIRLFQGGQSSGPAADPLSGVGGLCRVPEPGGLDSQLKPKEQPEQPVPLVQAVPVVLLSAVAGVDPVQVLPGHIGQAVDRLHRGGGCPASCAAGKTGRRGGECRGSPRPATGPGRPSPGPSRFPPAPPGW